MLSQRNPLEFKQIMTDDSSKRSAQFHPASNNVWVLIFSPCFLNPLYPVTSVIELRS